MKTSKRHTQTARNSSGRITVYHRGGGHKRLLRAVNWSPIAALGPKTMSPDQTTYGIVRKIEYDPNRSAYLALVESPTASKQITAFSYVLASENLKVNDRFSKSLPLKMVPIGSFVYNIEVQPGLGGQLVRSAGTFAQLIKKTDKHAMLRLPSGIIKQVNTECHASIGVVSNSSHITRKLTKAGQNRWLGIRPTVRGIAMNPIDHPHGGRTNGGRPSVSPWGKPTK